MPNRHERLFFCGRGGITFSRLTLQITYLLSIIYLSVYVVFTAQRLSTSYESADLYWLLLSFMILSPLLMGLVWFLSLPRLLLKFMLITNVTPPSLPRLRSR